VSECDRESSLMRWPWPTGGYRTKKRTNIYIYRRRFLRLKCEWKDNIKMDIGETGSGGVECVTSSLGQVKLAGCCEYVNEHLFSRFKVLMELFLQSWFVWNMRLCRWVSGSRHAFIFKGKEVLEKCSVST